MKSENRIFKKQYKRMEKLEYPIAFDHTNSDWKYFINTESLSKKKKYYDPPLCSINFKQFLKISKIFVSRIISSYHVSHTRSHSNYTKTKNYQSNKQIHRHQPIQIKIVHVSKLHS